MHRYACGPNNQHMVVIDLQPDSNTATASGARWQPGGDPPAPIIVDYVSGVEMCQRNPDRYKPKELTDDEHFALGRRARPLAEPPIR